MTRVDEHVQPERAAYWFFGGGDEDAWASIQSRVNGGATLAGSPEVIRWASADVWDRFTPEAISPEDNTLLLTADANGRGVVTGSGSPAAGNDRRAFLLPGTYGDVEMRVRTGILNGTPQLGLVIHAADGTFGRVAVMPWYNVLFSATGNFLPGVWEWDGSNTLHTNTQSGTSATGGQIVTATGSGGVITVKTLRPHHLAVGATNVVLTSSVTGGDGVIDTVPDALTFTMSGAGTGTVVGGTWHSEFAYPNRWLAARVVGNNLRMKQWRVDDPEPDWFGDRALSVTLPTTALTGGSTRATSGQVGLMFGHFASSASLYVSDLTIEAL